MDLDTKAIMNPEMLKEPYAQKPRTFDLSSLNGVRGKILVWPPQELRGLEHGLVCFLSDEDEKLYVLMKLESAEKSIRRDF